ncbi:GGDEF domain-containing protein [Actinoplanes sp. NEAU-A12]|uniref:GGDEF domain-containing protein n=1 Tax=Actinoplanes sandaracinus TaxID=3045177 RepID=A0ABT6WI89_9ACTN|nr:GGDEF domain-containing protein [Actinoplanes sandaracinus]MDI6099450.1 GGDEF domain-containing protein [Actinoplanes sandaracinus]
MPADEAEVADHEAAIEQAYLLVEAAQGHNDAARVEAADRRARARGWDDVRLLLHFARSLACLEDGRDGTAHTDAMLDTAVLLGDTALLALAIAVKAARRATRRRTSTAGESAAALLVQAVVMLDDDDPATPVVHRAGALIEVACVAHELGFWELALDYYELTAQALAGEGGGRWAETVRRQWRVVAINSFDLALDWASCLAAIGEWDAAAARAGELLSAVGDPTDDAWPPVWVTQLHGSRHLLTALAGRAATPTEERIASLGAAISAARAGDADRAARLAEAATDDPGMPLPTCTQLLRLSLIAKRPGTNPTAIRYGDELARLRWNDRVDRMSGMRDAIAVERRRRDHEQLRRDLVVDELTGLANRRGYQAYLAAVDGTSYAVMMIDVDRFKAVNDNFGHDVGDVVLARLGHILSAHVRPTDLAARLGGDEFVVILADVQPEVPGARAQHILDAVRTHPWDEVADGLTISVSIGVHHGGRHELPALLNDADRSLYHAKRHGRGRASTQVSTVV